MLISARPIEYRCSAKDGESFRVITAHSHAEAMERFAAYDDLDLSTARWLPVTDKQRRHYSGDTSKTGWQKVIVTRLALRRHKKEGEILS